MIVGSGMIASAFKPLEGVTVFAAGVANSREVRLSEFEREEKLLRATPGRLVYFGSCSVYGPKTPYTQHKLAMESIVLSRGGLVIRLPIVIGKSNNPHTLTNFLFDRISSGEPFDLQLRAHRHIVSVHDVVTTTIALVSSYVSGVVNLAYRRRYAVSEIVHEIEAMTGKKANTKPVARGDSYHMDSLIHANSDLQTALRTYYGDRCISLGTAGTDLRQSDASERQEIHAGRGVLTAH